VLFDWALAHSPEEEHHKRSACRKETCHPLLKDKYSMDCFTKYTTQHRMCLTKPLPIENSGNAWVDRVVNTWHNAVHELGTHTSKEASMHLLSLSRDHCGHVGHAAGGLWNGK
jgi:hypothetical protein